MAETIRADKCQCAIERCHKDWPGEAVLLDGYANKVFSVPAAWPDDHIWLVLEIVNQAFVEGISKGERSKAAEMRRAIGAKPTIQAIG